MVSPELKMMDLLHEDVKFRRYMIGHASVSILAQTGVIFPSISRKESTSVYSWFVGGYIWVVERI